MKFAVTGGSGFIGSHLTRHLVSQNHEVAVIDNGFRGNLENLEDIQDRISFFETDILDMDGMREAVSGADGVFHQAALTSVPESYEKEEQYRRVNVGGTENVFALAKEFGFKVVYASSSSVYGDVTEFPIRESTERNPINPYGMTKLEDEMLAERFARDGTKIIGLRYFNVYGRGQTLDYAGVITKFLDNIKQGSPPVIWGDGTQSRDFVFVEDVARANLAAMNSQVDCGFFNVGTGNTVTIKELADIMIELSGKDLVPAYDKLPKGDVRSSQAYTSLARERLSWTATSTLREGLSTLF